MKQKVILSAVTLAVVAGGVVAYPRAAKGEFDLPGLNQQVQRHDEQIENHEARITNTENDVKAVQTATNTAPATERVVVKEVVTQTPATRESLQQPENQSVQQPVHNPDNVIVNDQPQPSSDPNRGVMPSRGEVSAVIGAVAPPGEMRPEKKQACLDLFASRGLSHYARPGEAPAMDLCGTGNSVGLESYETY